ncbi:MAG: 50S ribosomal protein L29 [Opitutaceae bacterium]|nr:50S ribosomal protein L29 [Opitutaceae bacterium]
MHAKEIRELSPAEINTKIKEKRDELLQLRLRKNTGQVEKPHMFRALRKDIARLLTILNEKQRGSKPAA